MSEAALLKSSAYIKEIKIEVVRKSIHMMVAFVPMLARYNLVLTFSALVAGLLLYTYSEFMRLRGVQTALISQITSAATRDKDKGFVFGPVTLAIGTLMALMLYPEPAAAVAIYALAFGDGFSALFGKLFGRMTIPFTGGKTYAGSTACLLSVFLTTLAVSGSLRVSIIIAVLATFLESLPSGDLDNMIIPVGTGFVAVLVM
ncbi:MAG: phosphatidate cytidylyltransferase [Spirochaetia bacterium]|jgi:phytol kinase|nr:phosphatidate cytidylyltransferase [Spirochaetia bacterium]